MTLEIKRKRRPFIATSITRQEDPKWNFSGVEVLLTKDGIGVGGWYDSFVGIEPFTISWEQFDEERRAIFKKP